MFIDAPVVSVLKCEQEKELVEVAAKGAGRGCADTGAGGKGSVVEKAGSAGSNIRYWERRASSWALSSSPVVST